MASPEKLIIAALNLLSYGAGMTYDSKRPNRLFAAVGGVLNRYDELKEPPAQGVSPWLSAPPARSYMELIQKLSCAGNRSRVRPSAPERPGSYLLEKIGNLLIS